MKRTTKMSRAVGQFENMYNCINADMFNGELPTPIITVQSEPQAYGHMSRAKIWERKTDDETQYELNIGAESMTCEIEEVIDTMIHEMIHIYCRIHAIKETSGAYHNGKFRNIAESKGLYCFKDERYGWNTKGVGNERLIEYALSKGWSEIQIGRKTELRIDMQTGRTQRLGASRNTETGERRPSSTRKYVCPCCNMSVRATKDVEIICKKCMMELVKV